MPESDLTTKISRRTYGQHFTAANICKTYILPHIIPILWKYCWSDLFAGEGDLIFPLLDQIKPTQRLNFFRDHILLRDIQVDYVESCIRRAKTYGIPEELARRNIQVQDSLDESATLSITSQYPIFHLTNPPYLYVGYIMKNRDSIKLRHYFQGKNTGYQDLYQLALMNDARRNTEKMIYIIPVNFLFGNAISNKFRDDFLKDYSIQQILLFETKIFTHTGSNVLITFFNRKTYSKSAPMNFPVSKITSINGELSPPKSYYLDPQNHYRAGISFDQFILDNKAVMPPKFHYYLQKKEIQEHLGKVPVSVIDANNFINGKYNSLTVHVTSEFEAYIRSNTLWIRTIDTGTEEGRAGLYSIQNSFDVDGILVSKNTYRTHPIQLFFHPLLSKEDQDIIRQYFNLILEYLREQTESEFLTTYKYSNALYTRKYLGLSQAKQILSTFSLVFLRSPNRVELTTILSGKDIPELLKLIRKVKS